MAKFTLSNFNASLKANYSNNDTVWLSSGYTLRKLVGILGMLLPLLLYLFLLISYGIKTPLDSISHYYFTRVTSIFIIILGTLAIFLMVYKAEKSIDFYISFIAGIFALCVLLFPTSNITNICCDPSKDYAVTFLRDSSAREYFHYTSAAIFLLALAYMSLFLFTKSDKPRSEIGRKKKIRNTIYIVCGVIMLVALLVILLGTIGVIPRGFYEKYHLTYWMETVSIEAFGFSWLIKGRSFFKD